jgi:Na+/melibiose symporter-like transporter
MGFFHMFADARMPIWGVLAILSSLLLVVLSRSGQRWFYLASLLMLILFVILYNLWSKPINRLQTEAAKTGEKLDNARELQASWDRVLLFRVPLLVVSLLAQWLALLVASA